MGDRRLRLQGAEERAGFPHGEQGTVLWRALHVLTRATPSRLVCRNRTVPLPSLVSRISARLLTPHARVRPGSIESRDTWQHRWHGGPAPARRPGAQPYGHAVAHCVRGSASSRVHTWRAQWYTPREQLITAPVRVAPGHWSLTAGADNLMLPFRSLFP